MKTLPARVSIGRRTSNKNDDCIVITITDDISGARVCEVEMGLAEYAQCSTGLAYCHGVMKYFDTAPVGKKHENKTERVAHKTKAWFKLTPKEKRTLIKRYEVDGWVANMDDADNHHNWSGVNGCRITFHRYVENEENK